METIGCNNHSRKYNNCVLFIIVGVALFLRISTVDHHGIWIDEVRAVTTPNFHYGSTSIYPKFFEYPQIKSLSPEFQKIIKKIYDLHPVAQICFMMAADMHPPFFYIVSYCWTRAFGESLYAIRSLSIVIGLISILFLFLLIRLLFGDNIALLSAWFMAISPTHILYCQLARNFSLLILLVTLSFYFLYNYIIFSEKKYLISYFVSVYFSILTQYYAVFFIFVQFIIIILTEIRGNKLFSRWIVGFLVVVVCYIPWLTALYIQLFLKDPTVQSGLSPVSLNTFLNQFYYIGLCPSVTPEFISNTIFQYLRIINITFILCMIILGLYNKKHMYYILHIFLWVLTPIFLLSLLCIFKPLYSVKGLSPLIPAFAVMFAIGLDKIRPKRFVFVTVVSIVSMIMIGTQAIFPAYPGIQPTEDTRGAIAKLSKLIRPSDCVAVQPGFYRDGVWYYFRRDYIQLKTGDTLKGLGKCDKIWLFRYWDNGKPLPIFDGKMPTDMHKFRGLSVYSWD